MATNLQFSHINIQMEGKMCRFCRSRIVKSDDVCLCFVLFYIQKFSTNDVKQEKCGKPKNDATFKTHSADHSFDQHLLTFSIVISFASSRATF